MLNIFDFEEDVAYIIVARGWDYFDNDNIISLEKIGEFYRAIVRGTSDYVVTVEINGNGDILSSECTCPYDDGPVCKHEVAVYYALQEQLPEEPGCECESGDNLRDILAGQSKEKLVEFLLQLASESSEIRSRLRLEFDRGLGERDNFVWARSFIRSYIQMHSNRDGFISWDDVDDAVVGAEMVLEKAVKVIGDGEYEEGLGLIFCITQELNSALENTDDSSDVIDSILEEAFDQMDVVVSEMDSEDDSVLFARLLQESENEVYESEWSLRILEACARLVDSNERRDILYARLDEVGASGNEYIERAVAKIRHGIIKRVDGEVAAAQFALSQIQHPDFRELIIRERLKEGEWEQAVKLAIEGEEQDRRYSGLLHRWKKLRYEAYVAGGQVEEQRMLAWEFVLDGYYDFYLQLRETYLPTEWSGVYPELLKEMKERLAGHGNNPYCMALIEEKEFGLLLEYVQENPGNILKYLDHLMAEHREEALAVFRKFISAEALAANTRNKYRGVCDLIRRYANAAGGEQGRNVAQDLMVRFKQRRAFQQELKRLLSDLN